MAAPLSSVEKLSAKHDAAGFDCGEDALNSYLKKFAYVNQQGDAAQTYVVCRVRQIVGFYSLATGSVLPALAPARVVKGLAPHPVPVMILTRLAVTCSEQGRGLGQALLKDALLRTVQAADLAGIHALLVHAKNERARDWYLQFDFEPSPTDPLHLFLLMKDIRATLGR